MRLSGRIAVGALALVAAVAMAAPASAGQKFPTKVSIEYDDAMPRVEKRVSSFFGEVTSDRPACVEGRKVTLYRSKHRHSKPSKVGSFTTGTNGGWSVEETAEVGFYFARAKAKQIGAGLCEAKRSARLRFR